MNPVHHPASVKPPRPLAQNRRRGNRHKLQIPATLVPEGHAPSPIPVTVTEMSIGGVGFHCKQSLPLEGTFQLSSFDTLLPPGMRVRIVSLQSLPNGEFKIGAQTV